MDADVRGAVARSHLRDLPPDVLETLFAVAMRRRVPAGAVTHWEGEQAPHLELVVSGLVRVLVAAPDGRTMTVRYCRPGAMMGALLLFGEHPMPANTQALVDTELLILSPSVVRGMARRDVRVANAFLGELSERAARFIYEIHGSAFASVRQRVARHLLDLASDRMPLDGARPQLTVAVSQRELADAAGTVREVVVRVLRQLREEGVIRTTRDHIVILDPDRLVQEQGWNPGS
ncbi:MAG: Crp/Fnr family transcriptional regulator [Actinomycetota bacterium]